MLGQLYNYERSGYLAIGYGVLLFAIKQGRRRRTVS